MHLSSLDYFVKQFQNGPQTLNLAIILNIKTLNNLKPSLEGLFLHALHTNTDFYLCIN